jgi:phytoene synthase
MASAAIAAHAPDFALLDAYRDCQLVARRSAKNFYYSFLVLSADQRRAMCALYTFLRRLDDLGDSDEPVDDRRRALADWRLKLSAILGGALVDPNDRWWLALADTVERYGIPHGLLHAALDGVESDLDVTDYARFADLYRYCYRVASAVGLCCIRIWGAADRRADQFAEWCGIAFQLTNIIRDIAEDHARGRIYLPGEDLARFGVTRDDLVVPSPAVLELLHFEIARANDYYRRAAPLIHFLPPDGRAILSAMVRIYGGLLRRIERDPLAVLRRRVALSAMEKLAITLRALPHRFSRRSCALDAEFLDADCF